MKRAFPTMESKQSWGGELWNQGRSSSAANVRSPLSRKKASVSPVSRFPARKAITSSTAGFLAGIAGKFTWWKADKSRSGTEGCAGCELALVLGKSDMANLIAKQNGAELTEAQAIRRAKDGDAAAFECLYKAHCRRVYNLCLRMTKNPAEAEDLTQQAFLQLFRKISTFRGESGFSTWLHRVTANIVLIHLRRKKPAEIHFGDLERRGSDDEGPREHCSSDTSMFGAIERLNLMRAIRKLPCGYKQVFLLHDVIGYEHSEIAGLLGCSTGSSKSQLHKARKRLRRLVQGEQGRAEANLAAA
jgi:RNA polymerase sigma-70 factor (ECF subfamily)